MMMDILTKYRRSQVSLFGTSILERRSLIKLHKSKIFWVSLGIKIIFIAITTTSLHNDLFGEFLKNSIIGLGNSPWDRHLSLSTNTESFPYGIVGQGSKYA